jgi:hypothetical protein
MTNKPVEQAGVQTHRQQERYQRGETDLWTNDEGTGIAEE